MSSLSNQLKRKRDAEARYRRNEAPPVYIDGGSGPTPEPEIEQGVTSLNGQKGAISITAGANITITPGSGTIEIESTASGGAAAFTDLTDAPVAYTGEGGKVVAVKSTEDGLEFIDAPAGSSGAFDFGAITDTADMSQDWGSLA